MNKMDQKFNENEATVFHSCISAARDRLRHSSTQKLITSGKLLHLDQSAARYKKKTNSRDIRANRLVWSGLFLIFAPLNASFISFWLIIYIYRQQMQVSQGKIYK